MTTICWDGKTLAADRQVTIGNLKTSCTKIFRLRDGRLFAGSGECQDSLLVHDWLNGGERPSNLGENFVGLVVSPPGQVHRIEDKLVLSIVCERHHAIGSGAHFAIAAMACGKSAVEAVRIAARFDPGTGGRVESMRLGKK